LLLSKAKYLSEIAYKTGMEEFFPKWSKTCITMILATFDVSEVYGN